MTKLENQKLFFIRHFLWLYFIQNIKKKLYTNVYKYEFIWVYGQIKRCIYILMKCDTKLLRPDERGGTQNGGSNFKMYLLSLLYNLKQWDFFNKWAHQLQHVYIFFFFNHGLHAVTSSLFWICHFFWSIWLPGQTGNCYNSAPCSSVFAGKR